MRPDGRGATAMTAGPMRDGQPFMPPAGSAHRSVMKA
jgi:hypothetical protein